MRGLPQLLALILATALAFGCATNTPKPTAVQEVDRAVAPSAGLQIRDITIGTGVSPKPGQICVMHYTGWLYENGGKGKKFDSSYDQGQPFEFAIGEGKVIAGWDQGIASMKVGGKRTLIVPPELAYGAGGIGRLIPPNSTLLFEVELLEVKG